MYAIYKIDPFNVSYPIYICTFSSLNAAVAEVNDLEEHGQGDYIVKKI